MYLQLLQTSCSVSTKILEYASLFIAGHPQSPHEIAMGGRTRVALTKSTTEQCARVALRAAKSVAVEALHITFTLALPPHFS